MDIQSIIKNAIAKKLDEHKIVEVDNTPQVNSTSDYVKYLAEAVKFKIEELSKDTLQSYKAKSETQTSGPKGEQRKTGIAKAKGKIARKEMGLDRDKPSTESERAERLATHKGSGSPQGRDPSPEEKADAASKRTGTLSPEKIRGMGVEGKPHPAPSLKRAGVTRAQVAAGKHEKIAKGGNKLLQRIGRKGGK
jgi:hypothetical protein